MLLIFSFVEFNKHKQVAIWGMQGTAFKDPVIYFYCCSVSWSQIGVFIISYSLYVTDLALGAFDSKTNLSRAIKLAVCYFPFKLLCRVLTGPLSCLACFF